MVKTYDKEMDSSQSADVYRGKGGAGDEPTT